MKVKVKGHIWMESKEGHIIGPGRKMLLEAIRELGSITLAAKRMNMSYRHAWEMVRDMNSNSDKPLVIKKSGGERGGGSIITPEGEKLIAAFEKLNTAFEDFKMQFNQNTGA